MEILKQKELIFLVNKKKSTPNVSGGFQIVDEKRQKELDFLLEHDVVDEEELNYARQFMED
jgi:hypothetical protein